MISLLLLPLLLWYNASYASSPRFASLLLLLLNQYCYSAYYASYASYAYYASYATISLLSRTGLLRITQPTYTEQEYRA